MELRRAIDPVYASAKARKDVLKINVTEAGESSTTVRHEEAQHTSAYDSEKAVVYLTALGAASLQLKKSTMEEALQGDVNSLRQSKASLDSGRDRLYDIVASLCGQKYTDFHCAWTDLACKEEKLTADLKEVQRQKETLLERDGAWSLEWEH